MGEDVGKGEGGRGGGRRRKERREEEEEEEVDSRILNDMETRVLRYIILEVLLIKEN